MAELKISQLPQITAATDLDILAIVDSGATTTSKITKADLLSSLNLGNLVRGSGTSNYTTTGNEARVSGATNTILLTPTSAYTDNIGGNSNVILGGGGIGNGNITGSNVLIANGSFFENSSRTISGGQVSAFSCNWLRNVSSNRVFLAATSRASVGSFGDYLAMIATSTPSSIGNYGNGTAIIGGDTNNITDYMRHSVIAGGQYNTIQGQFIDQTASLFIGGGRYNTNASYGAGMVGGRNNTLGGRYNFLGGGQNIEIRSFYTGSIGGLNNVINNTSDKSIIVGGESNTITGTDNSVIGGTGNTLTANRSVILGGENITGTTDNTTYTQHLSSVGQVYSGYYDNGSGSTFTLDFNLGNTQKLFLNASGGTITFDNLQSGAHYRVIYDNPNGYTPSVFTASTRTIKHSGGSYTTYSGESICELFITDDDIYVSQLGTFS